MAKKKKTEPPKPKLWLPLTTKELVRRELARRSFREFVAYMNQDFEWNWHHEIACEELEAWALGKIKRLMIFMPPGHSKSELASRLLPAWTFGQNRDERFITTSYSDDLATAMNRDVQRIMMSSEYKNVFPEVRLNEKNIRTSAEGSGLRNSDIFEILGPLGQKRPKGYYRSAGRGAGITGMRGSKLIVDDPFKDWEEAISKTIQDKVYNWYATTFATRKAKNAGILIIQTRWNPKDLAGRILKEEASRAPHLRENWIQVKFEAIRTAKPGHPKDPRKEGEALWPWMLNENQLLQEKAALGTMMFSALFQQDPSTMEGNIFKREWFTNFWKELPAKADKRIQSWDFAFKDTTSSDFVAGGAFLKGQANVYLVDSIHKKMDFKASKVAVQTFSSKHPLFYRKLLEDKANGTAIINDLQGVIPGLIPVNPTDSKIVRAIAISGCIEAGNYYLPDPSLPGMSWVHDYIEEMCSFPNGENDDWVDMTTQALLELNGKGSDLLKKLSKD